MSAYVDFAGDCGGVDGRSDAEVHAYIAAHEAVGSFETPPCATKLFQFCRNGGKDDANISEDTRGVYAPILLRLLVWCNFKYVHIGLSGHHRHISSRVIVNPCMAGVWWTSIHTLFHELLLRARLANFSELNFKTLYLEFIKLFQGIILF